MQPKVRALLKAVHFVRGDARGDDTKRNCHFKLQCVETVLTLLPNMAFFRRADDWKLRIASRDHPYFLAGFDLCRM